MKVNAAAALFSVGLPKIGSWTKLWGNMDTVEDDNEDQYLVVNGIKSSRRRVDEFQHRQGTDHSRPFPTITIGECCHVWTEFRRKAFYNA